MTATLRRARDELFSILGGIGSLLGDGIGSIVRPSTKLYISQHPTGDLAKDYLQIGEDLRAVLRREYSEDTKQHAEAAEAEREHAAV